MGTLVPLAFFAVCVTTYFPGVEYNAAVLAKVLVPGLTCGGTPPKFQNQLVGPFEETSVNETASGAQPERGVAVMPATGTCAKLLKTTASSKKISKFSFLNNG